MILRQHIPVQWILSQIWSSDQLLSSQTLSTELPAVKPLNVHLHWACIIFNKEQGFPASPALQGTHLPSHPSSNLPQYLLEPVVLLAVGAIPAVAIPIGHHCVLVAEPAVHSHVCGLFPVGKGSVSGTNTEFSWGRGKQWLSNREVQEKLD